MKLIISGAAIVALAYKILPQINGQMLLNAKNNAYTDISTLVRYAIRQQF